ncbi:MAG: hypothetical protein AB7I18_10385 [Candidatus Berkiella sp.]
MLESEQFMAKVRKETLAELERLARSSELYEIRCGANYLATNVSERTTQSDLDVFKGQITGLLAKNPEHNDSIAFQTAYRRLRTTLPSRVSPRAKSVGILHSYGAVTREYEEYEIYEESAPLLRNDALVRQKSK